MIPYFCRKLGKVVQNLLSAAVVIGALRVNNNNDITQLPTDMCQSCHLSEGSTTDLLTHTGKPDQLCLQR